MRAAARVTRAALAAPDRAERPATAVARAAPASAPPAAAGGKILPPPPARTSTPSIPTVATLPNVPRRRAGASRRRERWPLGSRSRRLRASRAPIGQLATSAIDSGRSAGLGCSMRSISGRMRRSMCFRSGTLPALLDDLGLVAAHVDRLPGQRFGQHQRQAVDVRLRAHVAAVEAELLGRDVVVFAGKAAADDGAAAQAASSARCRNR